jgi:hypothetical protein
MLGEQLPAQNTGLKAWLRSFSIPRPAQPVVPA